ncbi:hypothetical protein [Mycobacterium deserti]|uniref:hypothetical protein n=1 Tax=Mycobacterium deserti TaxID=2978347 RepID=UPI0021B5A934|nr:hypothetical protein [Mycobacterium deserti]
MVDDAGRADFAAGKIAGPPRSTESTRPNGVPTGPDINAPESFDVDRYATMIYQANLRLGLTYAQIGYNTTPKLRHVLTQASAASTVRRRRSRPT